MNSSKKHIPPTSDAEVEKERSSVRPRVERAPKRTDSGSWTVPPAGAHMARWVHIATELRDELPADHPSARLLAVAIMRRDESLLRALVSSLSKARER